jgi:tetratricopeptide (TPR) repeat protein
MVSNLVAVGGFLVGLALVALLCRIGLVALHELGHGLAALALQAGRVTVYLGSHGQAAGGGRLQVGRLRVYFKYNPLRLALRGGLCRPQYSVVVAGQTWRGILFTLAGPLLPLLIAGISIILTFSCFSAATNVAKAMPIVFFGVALVSAIVNLWPRRQPITLANGKLTHNDGTQTRRLLQHNRALRGAREADAHFAAGRYADSARLDELLLGQLGPQAALYRRLVQAHLFVNTYAPALTVSRQFQQALPAEFGDDDLFTQGLVLSRLGQHELAIDVYTVLIEQPTPYANAYNNRGYTHNILGNYELAINDFNQAIAAEASVAYAYNNRGLARLKLSQEAAGQADIAHGLALDPANAYGYRNLGIYHLDRGEYAAALGLLEQAHQLDPNTHLLADYLQQTRQHLEASSRAGGPAIAP